MASGTTAERIEAGGGRPVSGQENGPGGSSCGLQEPVQPVTPNVRETTPGHCARQMRLLTLTCLYPSAARPRHGIFVETRLRKLVATGEASAQVIAPVPWFPSKSPRFGTYAAFAATALQEERHGLHVRYPRYAMIPRLGPYIQPWSLERAFMKAIRTSRLDSTQFDLVDAHYFYPDAVAAVNVARRLRLPAVITARGSDINLLGTMPWFRKRIVQAAQRADRIIAVSTALKQTMCDIGIDGDKITVLRNGVDLDVFAPTPRRDARTLLGLPEGSLVLSVGNLVPEKGHDLVIDAVSRISGARLVIVGSGPDLPRLRAMASARGMADRMDIRDVVPQGQLGAYYSAADVLALGSTREGWPNVVLEAMACGTPVVATSVGGVPEMIWNPHAGTVVPRREGATFASALQAFLDNPPPRSDVRSHAAGFGWDTVCRTQLDLYRTVVDARRGLR